MQRMDVTKEALQLTEKYIKAQLEFILESYKKNIIPTEEEKERIIIDVYGLREFEETDPEYADILSKVSFFYKNPEVDTIDN